MSNRRSALLATARRVIAMLAAAVAMVLPGGSFAYAYASTPSPAAKAAQPNLGPATPGKAVCTVTNQALDEITGMVATDKGIYVVQGGDTSDPSAVIIWTINPTTCAATSKNYGFDPADPEDLALGSDGALWVGDVGDGIGSDNQRVRVTMERVDLAGGGQAVPYRTLYPDSGKFNAQAVLLDKDNTPIIVANGSGNAILYRPASPLQANTESGLPKLTEVGEFTPAKTGTANTLGSIGNALVTGAAKSPDGKKVVIRTISDAYEFAVGPDGDVVKAVTQGSPTITPLPNEENGQAISYSADGTSLLTLSAVSKPVLRSYTPYVKSDADAAAKAPAAGGGHHLTFSDITNIALGIGLVGLISAVTGFIGIWRFRRQHRFDEYGEEDEEEEFRPVRRAPPRDRPRPDRRREPAPAPDWRGGLERWDQPDRGAPSYGRARAQGRAEVRAPELDPIEGHGQAQGHAQQGPTPRQRPGSTGHVYGRPRDPDDNNVTHPPPPGGWDY